MPPALTLTVLRERVAEQGFPALLLGQLADMLGRGEADTRFCDGAGGEEVLLTLRRAGNGWVALMEDLRAAAGRRADLLGRARLEADLRRGLGQDEFELAFCPVTAVAAGHPSGFEAVLRWRHSRLGLLLPDDFATSCQSEELAGQLCERALRMACKAAAGWPEPLYVAVPLTPSQMRAPRLAEILRDALEESSLAPRRLEIGAADGLLLQREAGGLAQLQRLRDLGVKLALDDFGDSVVALGSLRREFFDKVKVAPRMVRDIDSRPDDAAILHAVTLTCRGLGVSLLARGVRTGAELAHLAREGCDEAAGPLFGSPLEATAAARLMRDAAPGGEAPRAASSGPGSLPVRPPSRLARVGAFRVLHSEASEVLDGMAGIAAGIAGTEVAFITLIDQDRRWLIARHGIEVASTSRDGAICAGLVDTAGGEPVVADARRDQRLAADPLLAEVRDLVFYAGFPLVTSYGRVVGSLCVMDRAARMLEPRAMDALRLLAGAAVGTLELCQRIGVVQQAAFADPLTALPNRRSFMEALSRAIARQRRDRQPLSILYVDCDGLGRVNDEQGDEAGDQVLRAVAQTIQCCIREEDLPARLGGDEFGILLAGGDGAEPALVGERVRAAVEASRPSVPGGLTVSIGGVCCHAAPESGVDILAAADGMLHEAKRAGGNRVRVADIGEEPWDGASHGVAA
jgi:diguanylate cyclase (GGDEF)-like protein